MSCEIPNVLAEHKIIIERAKVTIWSEKLGGGLEGAWRTSRFWCTNINAIGLQGLNELVMCIRERNVNK